MKQPATAGAAPRPPLVILVAITAIGPLALNIFIPSLPGLQQAFDADYGTVQLVLSVYLVSIAVGQLFYGPLSDRYGRRPLLVFGLSVYLAGSLMCLFAPTIELLIAGRAIQALGGCAGAVLSRAMIADLYAREQAASLLAYVTMAMVLVPMLAPVIGGLLDAWFGWSAGFVLVLVLGCAVLVASLAVLHETHHERRATIDVALMLRDMLGLLARPAFLGHAMQVAFTSAVFFGFLAGAPYVMVELLGRSPAEYGVYFLMVSGTFMAGNFIAGRISTRIGVARMVGWGTGIALAAMIALALAERAGAMTPLVLFGTMSIAGFGNGLSIANGVAAAIGVDPGRIGAASGLSGSLQMGVGAGASYVIGALMADTATPLVAVMLICAVLAIASDRLGNWAERRPVTT